MNRIQQHKSYDKMVKRVSPGSNHLMDCIRAFLVGGLICTFAQFILTLLTQVANMAQDEASSLTTVIMIFLGSTLTGLGIYDDIGRFAGAGSIVPVTGFANSIVSAAMEYKREGMVLGVGARMFIIAGPVLVFGTLASVLVGVVKYLFFN